VIKTPNILDLYNKNIIFIADTHLKSSESSTIAKLKSSLLQTDAKYNVVCFLGDIFELWLGHNSYFIKHYSSFIDLCRQLIDRGIEIIFIEGNHEYNTKQFFSSYLGISCWRGPLKIRLNNKSVLLTHGDRLLNQGYLYNLFQFLTKNHYFTKIISYLFPSKTALLIGMGIAKLSRKKSSCKSVDYYFENLKKIIANYSEDILIFGHFHKNKHLVSNLSIPKKEAYCVYSGRKDTESFQYLYYDYILERFSFVKHE